MLKKIIVQVKDKAIGSAVIFMLTVGGTFLVNSGKELWDIPGTVRELKASREQDSSIYMSLWIGRNRYQDSINRELSAGVKQNTDTLRSIKWKLKRNKIK